MKKLPPYLEKILRFLSIQEENLGGMKKEKAYDVFKEELIGESLTAKANPGKNPSPSELTNSQLKKRYKQIHERMDKMVDQLIEAGFGNLKPSDMRKIPQGENKIIDKYLSLSNEASALRSEAESRYGPGFMRVEQLPK